MEIAQSPGTCRNRMSVNSGQSISRVSCLCFNWYDMCNCVFTCLLGNNAHQRSSSLIRGQIWVRVYQEAWTQTRYKTRPSSFCLPLANLFFPWKLTGVAGMTKQNGFCRRCLSLVKNVYGLLCQQVTSSRCGWFAPVCAADLKQNLLNNPEKCTDGDGLGTVLAHVPF